MPEAKTSLLGFVVFVPSYFCTLAVKLNAQEDVSSFWNTVDPFLGSVADVPTTGKNRHSLYRNHSVDAGLTYEIGDNALTASINGRGAIESVEMSQENSISFDWLPGSWERYNRLAFYYRGPEQTHRDLFFRIQEHDEILALNATGLKQDIALAHGLFPIVKIEINDLIVRQFYFVPKTETLALRAVVTGIILRNTAKETETTEERNSVVFVCSCSKTGVPGRPKTLATKTSFYGLVMRSAQTFDAHLSHAPSAALRFETGALVLTADHGCYDVTIALLEAAGLLAVLRSMDELIRLIRSFAGFLVAKRRNIIASRQAKRE